MLCLPKIRLGCVWDQLIMGKGGALERLLPFPGPTPSTISIAWPGTAFTPLAFRNKKNDFLSQE